MNADDRSRGRWRGCCGLAAAVLPLAACEGPQSALQPAGREAAVTAELFWLMLAGGGVIWALVIGTAVYAIGFRRGPHDERVARWFLLGGGVALPVAVLTVLLIYGLSLMSGLRAEGPALRLAVTGEQWWWRIAYSAPGENGTVLTANEIRLPAGRRVEVALDSADVIHSFWIPALAGKMDLIPGRTTRLILEPERPGSFRGVCAEYCGSAHALMAFPVEVMESEAFDAWLAAESAPAKEHSAPMAAPMVARGARLFQDVGCGACHTIRGTEAAGVIGPDLTHLAGRRSLAAGALPMTRAALERWIRDPQAVKPGARMPAFDVLGEGRIEALAAYLASLE